MKYAIGRIYNRRRDIHGIFGGQRQGGISTPREAPYVFLFTGTTGTQYGYDDRWMGDGMFRYTGEGQQGDMSFVRGNKAIRDHIENGKDLLLFEALGKSQGVRFLGSFACAGWETMRLPDTTGNEREAILFHLSPTRLSDEVVDEALPQDVSLDELRRRAIAATKPPSGGKQTSVTYHQRSEAVRQYVLARAAGVCEACGSPAPFQRSSGQPYLEPHHIRRLADDGPDHPRWVAGICPNCHREIHYGVNGDRLNGKVADRLGRLEGE